MDIKHGITSQYLAALEVCQQQVKEKAAGLDLEAASSGFNWLPFGKLELQFYNLRHLQQHIRELTDRLGTRAAADVDWIGRSSRQAPVSVRILSRPFHRERTS